MKVKNNIIIISVVLLVIFVTSIFLIFKSNSNPIGDYVEYDVAYTDICTEYKFSKSNGWRILDPGTKNSDGSYSGAKIISTGIPARLRYNSNIKEDTSGNYLKWWGTQEQTNKIYDTSVLSNNKEGYPNRYATTGLLENFNNIPFIQFDKIENTSKEIFSPKYGKYENIGLYFSIKNEEKEIDDTGKMFLTSKANSIHNLTLEEINNAINNINGNTERTSEDISAVKEYDLFNLLLLSQYGYGDEITEHFIKNFPYWITYPHGWNNKEILCSAKGKFEFGESSDLGLRPVIVLKNDIYKDGTIWKIK